MNTNIRRSFLALVASAGLFTVATSADAANCKSATAVFNDLWDKWAEVAKQEGCSQTDDPKKCMDDAKKYEEQVKKMVAFWNGKAGNSWAKLGPRRLEFGQKLEGKIVAVGERMFITETPVDRDSVTVTVKKTDGKAETEITVCKIDRKGNCDTLAEYTFDKGDKNDGDSFSRTFTGVKGHLLSVRISPVNLGAKSFSYTITANKK